MKIQSQELREDESADDGQTKGAAGFAARAVAQRDRQRAEQAAMVVIMMGRKRMRQPS